MKTVIAVAAVLALAFASSASAQLPIPGTTFMTRGLDMVAAVQKSDLTGKELLPVFSFSYDAGQTYTDPMNSSLVWKVPDQLVVTNVDQSVEQVDEALENTYNQWIDMMRSSFNVGVGVTIGQGTKAFSGNFKFNHESYKYKQEMTNSSTASGFSKHYWATHQLESYPPELMPLNPMFTQFVNDLPTTIKTAADQQKYNILIQYWGTHFASLANFGGEVHVSTFVKKSFLEKHSASWAANQFSLTFHYYLFQISAGGFFNHSQIHISSAFKEAATTFIFYRGGDIALQNNNTAGHWAQTIPQDPVYLNVTLNGLETLVSDPAKATQLGKVIQVYITTGKLPSTTMLDYPAFYADVDYVLDTKRRNPAGRWPVAV